MRQSSILQSLLLSVLTCVGSLAVPQPVSAQYFGNNFHGDFGVNSGTQSGPAHSTHRDQSVHAIVITWTTAS